MKFTIDYNNLKNNISVNNLGIVRQNPEVLPIVCTIKNIAHYFKISECEVRKLINDGFIKPLRGCRCPLKFSKVEIMNWYNGKK